MFSIVITLIAIALVAALALAAIYYGSHSLSQSQSRSAAATHITQGQQILAAAQLFKSDYNRWPNDINELVSTHYLQSIPVPRATSSASAELVAQWETVQLGQPYYWIHRKVSEPSCQEVNQLARGDNGIFNAAKPSLLTQCFGGTADYTVIIGLAGSTPDLSTVVPAADPGLTVDATGGGYAVAPTTSTGGTGSGTSTPAALPPATLGTFSVPAATVGDAPITLTAPTSNSTGPFTFTSSDPSVASISGNILSILTAGTVTITATQAATATYATANTSAPLVVSPKPLQWWSGLTNVNWQEASSYCPRLGTGWRLPTIQEYLNYRTQPGSSGYAGWLWASDTSPVAGSSYLVNYLDGRVITDYSWKNYYALCVK